MNYRFKVVKTSEIEDLEFVMITDGFNESFRKFISSEQLKKYYQKNILDDSLHVICYTNENILVGSTSVFPYYYSIPEKSEKVLLGLSGGSFIKSEFRKDLVLYKKMYLKLREFCANYGILAIIGIPNENLFAYTTKLLTFKYYFDLDYYFLPYYLPKFIGINHRSINQLSSILTKVYLSSFSMLNVKPEKSSKNKAQIFNRWEFYKIRYNSSDYSYINTENFKLLIKVHIELDKKILYLLDFEIITKSKYFYKAIKNLCSDIEPDGLVYIGTKRINPLFMFIIPNKFVPKRLAFTVDYIDKALEKELIGKESWDFNLSSFDGR